MPAVAGAEFIRADLHVHTHGDGDFNPQPACKAYVDAAVANGLGVLAITDHNSIAFVRDVMKAAEDHPLLVLPGIEVSTHDGHLLGLFPPDSIAALEDFASTANLQLKDIGETEKRSSRSLLDLLGEIHDRGGLAIPAHIDVANGAGERLNPAEVEEMLASPALAGLEFATKDALAEWFTDTDPDPVRRAAWKGRQAIPDLRERGLARLMSSDAHAPDKVGRDRASRTLTRLRLDDLNFQAVRNAIAYNPKARCKAETMLPASYPWIQKASFRGGFLDGVNLEFSPNLNCIIGGRGSGKSTALLAIRAALGGALSPDERPDADGRMPDETVVEFIDRTGSQRVAVRKRGSEPMDRDSGALIRLRLADLGQDESGRVARGYDIDPAILLSFLDNFVVRHEYDEAEVDLLSKLAENEGEITRTTGYADQIKKLTAEQATLEASLQAARNGKVEQVAEWATLLSAQRPLLDHLGGVLASDQAGPPPEHIDIDALASGFGVELSRKPASDFVDGDRGLRAALGTLHDEKQRLRVDAAQSLKPAQDAAKEVVARWATQQADLEERLKTKRAELQEQGLKVQAGAVEELVKRLNKVKSSLRELSAKKEAHQAAIRERSKLLTELNGNRDRLFERRKATLKKIADESNASADGLKISVYFKRAALNTDWIDWLGKTFGFRSPRVNRLAAKMTPAEFADHLYRNVDRILELRDDAGTGDAFFADPDAVTRHRKWPTIFKLQTMRCDDLPRIEVHLERDDSRRSFAELSAGQQRSVLLSLLLCADRDEPLVLDQPEDHLDAHYIARAVVKHLEAAKEKRQVLIATHSPNLTVLGDAELVIPLKVEDGKGRLHEVGAVDRPATRDQVCALLEGGVQAYGRRGERYGFRFSETPTS